MQRSKTAPKAFFDLEPNFYIAVNGQEPKVITGEAAFPLHFFTGFGLLEQLNSNDTYARFINNQDLKACLQGKGNQVKINFDELIQLIYAAVKNESWVFIHIIFHLNQDIFIAMLQQKTFRYNNELYAPPSRSLLKKLFFALSQVPTNSDLKYKGAHPAVLFLQCSKYIKLLLAGKTDPCLSKEEFLQLISFSLKHRNKKLYEHLIFDKEQSRFTKKMINGLAFDQLSQFMIAGIKSYSGSAGVSFKRLIELITDASTRVSLLKLLIEKDCELSHSQFNVVYTLLDQHGEGDVLEKEKAPVVVNPVVELSSIEPSEEMWVADTVVNFQIEETKIPPAAQDNGGSLLPNPLPPAADKWSEHEWDAAFRSLSEPLIQDNQATLPMFESVSPLVFVNDPPENFPVLDYLKLPIRSINLTKLQNNTRLIPCLKGEPYWDANAKQIVPLNVNDLFNLLHYAMKNSAWILMTYMINCNLDMFRDMLAGKYFLHGGKTYEPLPEQVLKNLFITVCAINTTHYQPTIEYMADYFLNNSNFLKLLILGRTNPPLTAEEFLVIVDRTSKHPQGKVFDFIFNNSQIHTKKILNGLAENQLADLFMKIMQSRRGLQPYYIRFAISAISDSKKLVRVLKHILSVGTGRASQEELLKSVLIKIEKKTGVKETIEKEVVIEEKSPLNRFGIYADNSAAQPVEVASELMEDFLEELINLDEEKPGFGPTH